MEKQDIIVAVLAVLIVALIIIAVYLFVSFIRNIGNINHEKETERAGRQGEDLADEILRSILIDGDLLFRNVSISYDRQQAEIDFLLVNKFGVFVFEVKNYSGEIAGAENDAEWQKIKTTHNGNQYVTTVKNPIKQMKRQVYILANYLKYYGQHVWVDGYVIMIQRNEPVRSKYIISDIEELNRIIHTKRKHNLDNTTVEGIKNLIGDEYIVK